MEPSSYVDFSPLIVVLGPTGSGKSELGVGIASKFNGEIVSCDSVQVYRHFEIGSAKLPFEQRLGVPHHLIDILDADQDLTAGAYSRLARETISTVHHRGCLPIVVGGTGFYLRALLEGLSPAPARDETVRARLSQLAGRRPAALHRFLRTYDPKTAARIHANDHQKLIRAIEMMLLTQQPASQTRGQPRDAFSGAHVLKIGLNPDRRSLYQRLNERSTWMFHHGLIEETKALLEAGLSADWKPLQSLGYKQAVGVLRENLPIDEAIRDYQTKTRQYAKRQLTWFRRETNVTWLNGFGSEDNIKRQALQLTETFLA